MVEVLVADDDANVRDAVSDALEAEGLRVARAANGLEAAGFIRSREFQIAVCDVQMPGLDGLGLLRLIRQQAPGTAVILMTSHRRAQDAIESLRSGAVDYVIKPFDPVEFARGIVGPLAARESLLRRSEAARAGARIVAVSHPMRILMERLMAVASGTAPVVLVGAAGSGKKTLARAMHAHGERRNGPMLVVRGEGLTALDETRLRGASGGTLVIEGVERLGQREQAHLARMISEESVVARLGPTREPLGVRIVTLTGSPLLDHVAEGRFLESLYFRLCGVQLRVPPLSEREDDVCHLVVELLSEMQPAGRTAPTLSRDAWLALRQTTWPGNLSQLRSTLEQALASSAGGRIDVHHLARLDADVPER